MAERLLPNSLLLVPATAAQTLPNIPPRVQQVGAVTAERLAPGSRLVVPSTASRTLPLIEPRSAREAWSAGRQFPVPMEPAVPPPPPAAAPPWPPHTPDDTPGPRWWDQPFPLPPIPQGPPDALWQHRGTGGWVPGHRGDAYDLPDVLKPKRDPPPVESGGRPRLYYGSYMWWKLGISTAANLAVRFDAWPTFDRVGVSGILGTVKITWLAGPLDKTMGTLTLYKTVVTPSFPSPSGPPPENGVAAIKQVNLSQSNGMPSSKPDFVTGVLAPQDANLTMIQLPGVIAMKGLILVPFGNQGVSQLEGSGQIGMTPEPSKSEGSWTWTLPGVKMGTDRGNQLQYSLQRTYFEVWGGFQPNPA